jgi:hypothetical protein
MSTTREVLEEAKKDNFAAEMKKIARMTADNLHTDAIIAGAKLLGNKRIQKIAELIDKIHEVEGSMPSELITYRNSIQKQLGDQAKEQLTPEQLNLWYTGF